LRIESIEEQRAVVPILFNEQSPFSVFGIVKVPTGWRA
jgi:hypothetical protein